MKSIGFIMLILIGCTLLSGARGYRVSYRIIVNEENPVTSLTRDELAKLFLKKTKAWTHGGDVMVVDQTRESQVRSSFSEDVLDKSAAAVKAYWQRKAFSGRMIPPEEMDTDEEVLIYVRKHPGAIGYISIEASVDGVRIIEITD